MSEIIINGVVKKIKGSIADEDNLFGFSSGKDTIHTTGIEGIYASQGIYRMLMNDMCLVCNGPMLYFIDNRNNEPILIETPIRSVIVKRSAGLVINTGSVVNGESLSSTNSVIFSNITEYHNFIKKFVK